ncbi:MAG TPA: multicopper oxidase domain-containing protein [Solirubrobacteraceae bacterium]|nr:multicopper oxidase domain-containing protein [Solirubrobacteraceae bacterium]
MARALAIAAVVVVALLVAAGDGGLQLTSAGSGTWTPVPGQPLREPSQIRSAGGVLDVTLTAGPQTVPVGGDDLQIQPFTAKPRGKPALPASIDGPTLHVRPRDTIRVTFVNELGGGAPTNIHYHGMHVSPLGRSDNVFRTFADGRTYRSVVRVPRDQSTGTYWYHVHFHGSTESQVMGGLSGLLIVDGLASLLPERLRGVQQRQLALRDVQTSGDAIVAAGDINPNQPSTRLVNGLYQPAFTMKSGRHELWRLANIGADVFYKVQLPGHRFAVIAEDGVPVWKVTRHSTLLLAPGKRFDVLVRGGKPGSTYALQSLPYAQHATKAIPASAETLATVTVAGARPRLEPLPRRLVRKHDLSRAGVDEINRFVFSYTTSGAFAALINGRAFSPGELPAVSPVRGSVEEWTLENATDDDHPFHIHVNDFQVMSVNGVPYRADGVQDVVTIPKQRTVTPPGGTPMTVNGEVVIRQRFEQFSGWYVFHCHILEHEDAGMMATIQVRRSARDPVRPPPGTRIHHG